MKEGPWYRSFFEQDYFDTFYRPLRAQAGRLGHQQTEAEAGFIARILDLHPGSRVLDLACGHGRHAVALAKRGFDITGLDISRYHIDLARRAAAEAGVTLRLICDDMRNLPTRPPYDAIYNYFTSFGYLESHDEDQKVLDRVAAALAPGGRFLLETNNALRTLREFQPATVTRLDDGAIMLEERAYDALAGRIHGRLTFIGADGERRTGEVHPRLYMPAELARMLTVAGLDVVAACGDIDDAPLDIDARRCILLARRPLDAGPSS